MTPDWLDDTVQAFGRQMGLSEFRFADNGAAGLRFENGQTLRFEYVHEALMVTLGFPSEPDTVTLEHLLQLAHPSAPGVPRVRAAYLARTGEAILTVRLAEREVTVTTLEAVFRRLWAAAATQRRIAS